MRLGSELARQANEQGLEGDLRGEVELLELPPELAYRLGGALGADEQSGTFMLFVMLLVVAISSMLASSLPIAVLALTLPVTIAIASIAVGLLIGYRTLAKGRAAAIAAATASD